MELSYPSFGVYYLTSKEKSITLKSILLLHYFRLLCNTKIKKEKYDQYKFQIFSCFLSRSEDYDFRAAGRKGQFSSAGKFLRKCMQKKGKKSEETMNVSELLIYKIAKEGNQIGGQCHFCQHQE